MYLTKVLQSHKWLDATIKPTPMKYDKLFLKDIHIQIGQDILEDQSLLSTKMGFKYRSGIGELLFAAITC